MSKEYTFRPIESQAAFFGISIGVSGFSVASYAIGNHSWWWIVIFLVSFSLGWLFNHSYNRMRRAEAAITYRFDKEHAPMMYKGTKPGPARAGDMWIKGQKPDGSVDMYIWSGTDWEGFAS